MWNLKLVKPNRAGLSLLAGGLGLACLAALVLLYSLLTYREPGIVALYPLLLESSDLPSGAAVFEGPLPISYDMNLDSGQTLSIIFSLPRAASLVEHNLYVFPNAFRAQWAFGSARSRSYNGRWELPPGWTWRSRVADEFEFRCGDEDNGGGHDQTVGTRCAAVARYGRIVSEFSTPFGPGVMTLSDVQRALEKLDARLGRVK